MLSIVAFGADRAIKSAGLRAVDATTLDTTHLCHSRLQCLAGEHIRGQRISNRPTAHRSRRVLADMRVYLDNNASTAPDPAVIDAIARAMADLPGNSSSAHFAGRSADAAVENARETLGALLNCRAGSLVFTSGATEANNLALVGLWEAQVGSARRRRIVVSASEHPAILETAHYLASRGADVVTVPVTGAGAIDLVDLDAVAVSYTHLTLPTIYSV